MDTVQAKPRQSASLYSWNTAIDQIKVRVSGNNLEVRIGELTVLLSPANGEKVLDLAKAFSEVEVTETTTSKVRV
jgi:hypothetical protein